jgi:hypothetical protein
MSWDFALSDPVALKRPSGETQTLTTLRQAADLLLADHAGRPKDLVEWAIGELIKASINPTKANVDHATHALEFFYEGELVLRSMVTVPPDMSRRPLSWRHQRAALKTHGWVPHRWQKRRRG